MTASEHERVAASRIEEALEATQRLHEDETLTELDYSYADVFARQVEGLGDAGDIALALSTSGASENVVRAVEAARQRGLTTIAMTGPGRSSLGDAVDHCLRLPGADVPRIQECHLVAAHILCEIVDRALPDGVPPGA
jgi:D-sedoheptulose 7-phosphate isomerase